MAIQRTVFTKAGTVAEVSMCDPDYCDHWCVQRTFDGWAPATAEPADVLREVQEGDTLTASKRAGQQYELNPATAHVTRYGVKFVEAGVRDYAKLAQANALAPQPVDMGAAE